MYEISRLWENPPPIQLQLTTFANTEIYQNNQVHPGTFRIELSKEKLLGRAVESKEKMVIVYPPSPTADKAFVEYWLPATGSAFYHAAENIGEIFTEIDRVELVNNLLIIHHKYTNAIFWLSILSLTFMIAGFCLIFPKQETPLSTLGKKIISTLGKKITGWDS